ncbi:hypothetical protein W02_26730 [Nitrospira sp. KM1]|uniref:CV_2116 domain-containing protein n=1 Tax=Nitrospira sp. KM1 TaxID=1936990 RepID=UPI0013A7486E|nr:hypothetical protein [Nitrospira sp. KM1]BCA55533.1 hypothetical protein W02_26730 [Nitrospira sp. KM1]
MSKEASYKNYRIKSQPIHVLDSQQWLSDITIFWETGSALAVRHFTPEGVYQTETDADVHGIAYAERVIDGKVVGQSLSDSR